MFLDAIDVQTLLTVLTDFRNINKTQFTLILFVNKNASLKMNIFCWIKTMEIFLLKYWKVWKSNDIVLTNS